MNKKKLIGNRKPYSVTIRLKISATENGLRQYQERLDVFLTANVLSPIDGVGQHNLNVKTKELKSL